MKYGVAVLGASSNPERYSHMAVLQLAESGYNVFPVHPSKKPVGDFQCYPNLEAIDEPIDTISVYLSEATSTPLIDAIIAAKPRRVILNPGAENDELKKRCESVGIDVMDACTLVLLRTGQF